MNSPAAGSPNAKATRRELARLKGEIAEARAELALVEADLSQAQARLGGHQMVQLLEANEQLVVDAMRMRRDAETSAFALEAALRSSERDPLTGLPNRSLLIDRFQQATAGARRHENCSVALLFLDLDRFKENNDRFGHAVGDQILIAASRALTDCVRGSDTVCRLGGDEFVILLAEVIHADDPALVAAKVRDALLSLTQVGGQEVSVSASIGVGVYPEDGGTLDALLEAADIAMFLVKRAGGNGFARADRRTAQGAAETGGVASVRAPIELRAPVPGGDVDEAEAARALVLELQRRSRAKDEFLAVLGHELRNPLAPIVSTLDALRLLAGGAEGKEHQLIRRHVTHMVRLIDELLDIAKLSARKIKLRDEEVAIAEVLEQAVSLARPLLDQHMHRFLFTGCEPRLACRGDAVRLAQCVSNLLINSARYTPPGGTIELLAMREAQQIVIRVRDNGRGISEEQMAHVFELFFQVQGLGTEPISGLGVGLALVRSLVELHGGTVEGRSAGIGRGSEFVIRLPAIDAQPPLQAAELAGGESAWLARRVLLVDDNQDAAASLATLLALEGHQVWTAHHPNLALTLAAQVQPQIAILDIGLPGMDGYQLAQEIRRRHPGMQTAFIALTGYGSAREVERSVETHFDAHLLKPVAFSELQVLIQKLAAAQSSAPRPSAFFDKE
ncbi:diguanylate cyclase domain-containing protein [Roseateles violae]|uniref:histidine kinase n=1 Tax=Roseateles violae TaxID=3058042 RepID=A0ABT8E076_9BURK|nr:diguanylate cyclase [Pelomonas sp. PFR6]MDN3923272.1 diguanylate cyclase [Pelomonas sp. PFR6]